MTVPSSTYRGNDVPLIGSYFQNMAHRALGAAPQIVCYAGMLRMSEPNASYMSGKALCPVPSLFHRGMVFKMEERREEVGW